MKMKCLFLSLIFLCILVGCGDPPASNKPIAVENKFISGVAPVDVYLNMEKQGFETEKKLSGEYGNFWISKLSKGGIEYDVQTYSSDASHIESVEATAMIDLRIKKSEAVKPFLQYVASLPYETSDPQKAGQWVSDNLNKDKASIIIGDVKFEMFAPSPAMRMLRLEKAK